MSWLRELVETAIRENREFQQHVVRQLGELKEIAMSDQDTLNAEAAKIDAIQTSVNQLVTTATDLVGAVNALKQANPALDFSAIDTKLGNVQHALDLANANIADPGAPTPAPTPAPAPTPSP